MCEQKGTIYFDNYCVVYNVKYDNTIVEIWVEAEAEAIFFHCGSGSGSFLILSGGWKRKRKLLKNFRNSSLHIIFKCEFFISLCQFFSNLL